MEHEIKVGQLLDYIESISHNLTKAEKKVAEFVLKKPEAIIYKSVTDFAEMVGVGDTTIIRFCRTIGLKGYQGFKMVLAQEISMKSNEGENNIFNQEIDEDNISSVIQKLNYVNISAINQTISLLDEKEVVKAVDMINDARKICFYGVGISGITALDGKYKFLRVGLNADCSVDGHFMAMDAALLDRQGLAIGISYSGSTKDTVEALKIAKQNNSNTICITHHIKSPITQYADVVLLTGSKEGPFQGGSLATKIAQLFVIDVLYNEYFRRNKEKCILNRKKTGMAIEDKLY